MLYGSESVENWVDDIIDYRDVLDKVDQRRKDSLAFIVNALS